MGRSIHDDGPIPGDRGKLALTYPYLHDEIMEELEILRARNSMPSGSMYYQRLPLRFCCIGRQRFRSKNIQNYSVDDKATCLP